MTRLAVLIDADNAAASLTAALFAEIARYGTPTIKRAYGDWRKPQLKSWKAALPQHEIQSIQQDAFVKGKNATDAALIIEAMDLLYAGNVDGFVIVSSDSDFTPLAVRLRQAGKLVYGVGRRDTSEKFKNECNTFIDLELLLQEPPKPKLKKLLTQAIRCASNDEGWSNIGEVCNRLKTDAVDSRLYGHAKLGKLVRSRPYVEVRRPGPWVRLKPKP